MRHVRSFAELRASDAGQAGGKAANLARLVGAGLPVPQGFVILTSAHRAVVSEDRLGAALARLGAGPRAMDATQLERASVEIRAELESEPIPDEILEEVARAYRELGSEAVAVRSSATGEDGLGASFAGQHESFLNVVGEDALARALHRCWSSLFTARALAYRARFGIPDAALAIAVVVQRLVVPESAGVLFTANPLTGHRGQLVIDAAFGLGEAIVGGHVTPDHWVVDARSREILERRIASKELMTVCTPSGTRNTAVPAESRDAPSLPENRLTELCSLGLRAASVFGTPQDVEWVLAKDGFALVQSRPITSLFPLPEPASARDGSPRVYVSLNSLQGVAEPLTPAGVDFLGRLARGPARLLGVPLDYAEPPPVFGHAAGRVFLDVTGALGYAPLRRLLLGLATFLDRPTAEILEQRIARGEPAGGPGGAPVHPSPRLALGMGVRAAHAAIAPAHARRRALAKLDRFCDSLEERARSLVDGDARRRFTAEGPEEIFPTIVPTLIPVVIPAVALRFPIAALLERWLGDASGLEPVLRALPHNPTTEMDQSLWRLARELAAEGSRPTADDARVQAFLARHGHRAIREIDVGMPRFSDDPDYVLGLLESYARQEPGSEADRRFEQSADQAERAAVSLVARVRERRGRVRAALLSFLLGRMRALAGMREYPKFYAVRTVATFRRVLHEIGTDLVEAGRLDRATDVFFLRFPYEGDLRHEASEAHAAYELDLERRAPRVLTSEGETFFTAAPAAADATGALVGTPVSSGVYEGAVRVVRDPQRDTLESGEVLVARGTDPAWTPLFLTAGALVMEIGGIMSHGSVVARECGIPAVVGVPDATLRLRTGQRVRVDGGSGHVTPVEVQNASVGEVPRLDQAD